MVPQLCVRTHKLIHNKKKIHTNMEETKMIDQKITNFKRLNTPHTPTNILFVGFYPENNVRICQYVMVFTTIHQFIICFYAWYSQVNDTYSYWQSFLLLGRQIAILFRDQFSNFSQLHSTKFCTTSVLFYHKNCWF